MAEARNLSLEIKRFINAPRDRVYAAWTDPAQLKEWFGPEKVQTRNIIADTRVGGEFRWDLTNCDGEDVTIHGEYREIQPNKKIVFTWKNPGDPDWQEHLSIVTVEFSDHESGTEVRLIHEQLPTAESCDRHSEGWNSVLGKLQKFCNR
jgi:uncharacterized protein YndB with AHSA1/START domain